MMEKILIAFIIITCSIQGGQGQWYDITPSDEYFNVIKFNGSDTGWVMGNFCKILKTEDSGNSWNDLSCNYKADIQDFQFVSSSMGYSISSNFNGEFEISKLFKTENGGIHWDSIYSTEGWLDCLSFLNENVGFIGGDTGILKTNDGGYSWEKSWTFKNSGFKYGLISSIIFINDSIGFASGYKRDDLEYSTDLTQGIVLKTTNYGINWQLIYDSQEDHLIGSLHYSRDYNMLYACNIRGNDLFTSSDLGDTWSVLETPVDENTFYINAIASPAENKIVFVASTSIMLLSSYTDPNGYLAIYQSNDNGITWSKHYIDSFPLTPLDHSLSSIYFVNDSLGFCSGWKKILKTANGGGISINQSIRIDENRIINFYPNPASKSITIELNLNTTNSKIDMNILDISGKQVFHTILYKQNYHFREEIPINLKPGFYLISIMHNNGIIAKKISIID